MEATESTTPQLNESEATLTQRIDAAIRFTVPITQQAKLRGLINELLSENAALREQLAEAEKVLKGLGWARRNK